MSTLKFAPRNTNNQMLPPSGPKFLPLRMDFTSGNTLAFDLSTLQDRGFISQIQTLYADNSNNGSPLVLTFGTPGAQNITVPAGFQGYYPVLFPDHTLSAFSAGAVAVNISLINVPIPPTHWGAVNGVNLYDINGYLKTADQYLAPLVVGAKLQVQAATLENLFQFNLNVVSKHAEIAAAAVSAANLFGDAVLNSYWLDSFDIAVTNDASKAAAGLVNVQLVQTTSRTVVTGGTTIWSKKIYVPAAAGNALGVTEIGKREQLSYHNASGANGFLHLVLDNALTTGTVMININGGTTNVIT